MFTLKIETDNAAFGDGNGAYELERLLREIGETIRLSVPDTTAATAEGTVRDANGNRVGAWSLNAPEDELEGALSLPPEDSGTAKGPAAGVVDAAWLELGERDDRTSPEEYPEMCLITRDELAEFMRRAQATGHPFGEHSEAYATAAALANLDRVDETGEPNSASLSEITGWGSRLLDLFDGEPGELARIQRGDETVRFPVHIQRWPRMDDDGGPADPVAFVLSLAAKPWVLQQVWGSLRLAGVEFPAKGEAEFAVALHWMIVHVLTPGTGGVDTIDEALKAMRAEKADA